MRRTPSSSSERYASLTAHARKHVCILPDTVRPVNWAGDTDDDRPRLLRLFRVIVELKIKLILRLFLFEACLDDNGRRQRRLGHARGEKRSGRRGPERDRRVIDDDPAREPL